MSSLIMAVGRVLSVMTGTGAKELGADFKLHYMNVPYSELYRRLEERNRNLPEGAFAIPKAEMDRYVTIFQPPTGDELV